MKRTITSVAAATMALGMLVPVAFASSTTTSSLKWSTLNITAGSYTASPKGFAAPDHGSTTETTFAPVFYVQEALKGLGYTVNWDGTNLNVQTPSGVSASLSNLSVGSGDTGIYVNGTLVKKVYKQVQKDPAGGASAQATTYVPIYYINALLSAAGESAQWNGSGWALTKPVTTPATSSASLSAITVSKASSGIGSATNPAVSLTGSAVQMSTTLTDANGNPLTNTAVTFNVSNYGTYPSGDLPTVENANGTVLSQTQTTNAAQYTVYTDATGTAAISFQGMQGSTYAYEVVATAPYAGSNNTAISSQPAYVEFVANNQGAIAPLGTLSTPYNGALGTAVPISVILPPNAQGQTQANVTLTLNAQGGTISGTPAAFSAGTNHASFASSTGAVLGSQIQVTTNSAGVATAYLSDSYGEAVRVSVSNLPTGVSSISDSYVSFSQTGVAAKINNFSISSTSPNIGQTVYVSGQLQDAAGNPVAKGQVLVTADNGDSNNLAYVSGSTTTAFPVLGTNYNGLTTGTPATNAYGDVVTADANGNFSFGITDTRVETEHYAIYGVNNGQIQGGALSIPSGDNTLQFNQSNNLAIISVGAFDAYVQANSATSMTGGTATINGGGILEGQVHSSSSSDVLNQDNGSNPYIAQVYAEPQNSAGHHTSGALNLAETYSLSLSNGGQIYSINGHYITPAAAVSLQYTPGTGFVVNGNSANVIPSLGGSALAEDFEVGVTNGNSGSTVLTIASGSVSSTATVNFNGGTPAKVATVTPGSAVVNPGGTQTIKFTVEDYNGNPVANTNAAIGLDDTNAADPFWITGVNGVTLQQSLNMGTANQNNFTTLSTPIPVGKAPTSLNYNVNMPGVVNWSGGNTLYATSDSNGNISLTVQAGGLTYPVAFTGSNTASTNNTVYLPGSGGYSASGTVGLYTNKSNGTYTVGVVYSPSNDGYAAADQVGQITW